MESWIIWIIIASVLLILEVLTQMIWTLCLAIGCLAAMIAALSGIDFIWQMSVLAVVSVLSFVIGQPMFRRVQATLHGKERRDDRTGMDALVGRRTVVTEPIYPDRLGRVRIDGDSWQASASSEAGVIESGEEVVVTDYDSIVLHVRRVSI